MRPLGVTLLFLILAGCAQSVDMGPPPAVTSIPDLRGTWVGTWGGSQVELVIVEQLELGERAGVYLGPIQVLGRRRPGVSGVLTSSIAGKPVSANAEGWLGYGGAGLMLLLRATTPSGAQQLTLSGPGDRWSGHGESEFAWGPQGQVDLARPATAPR